MPTYEVTSPKTGKTYSFETEKEASQDDLLHAMKASDDEHVDSEVAKLRGGVGHPVDKEEAKIIAQNRIASREKLWDMPNAVTTEVTPSNAMTSPIGRTLAKIGSLGMIDIPEPGSQHVIDKTQLNAPMKALATANEFLNGATMNGMGALERGGANLMVKAGLASPEMAETLSPKNLQENAGAAGVASNFLGSVAPGMLGGGLITAPKTLLAKALTGFGVGGAAGGVSELLREFKDAEDVNPSNILSSAGVGGAFGAGLPLVAAGTGKALSSIKGKISNRSANVASSTAKADAVEKLANQAAESVQNANKMPVAPEIPGSAVDETAYMPPSGAKIKAKEAQQAAEAVKTAVSKGIDPADTGKLSKLNYDERPEAVKMAETARKISVGDPDAPTTEEFQGQVGEHLRTPFKQLNEIRHQAGEELGGLVDSMPDAPIQSQPGRGAADLVFSRMKKGLKGLKVAEDGTLDFDSTRLKGPDNKAARDTIQEYFGQIAKEGNNPQQAHTTRQVLFDILDGQTRPNSNVKVTPAQDRTYQDMRGGLADFLEENVPGYKEANKKFAQAIGPIQKMNKYFRKTAGDVTSTDEANADILDSHAGIIARRLTSNATSREEIRSILKEATEALSQNGIDTKIRPEKMQEVYNILAKHYPNVVPETSFAGQTSLGIKKSGIPTTMMDIGKKVVEKVGEKLQIGETDATKNQALHDLLDALSKKPKITEEEVAAAATSMEGKASKAAQSAQDSRNRDALTKQQDEVKNAELRKQAIEEASKPENMILKGGKPGAGASPIESPEAGRVADQLILEKKLESAMGRENPPKVGEVSPENPKGLPPGYNEIFKEGTLKDIKMQQQQRVLENLTEAEKLKILEKASKKMLIPKSQLTRFKNLKQSDIDELMSTEEVMDYLTTKGKPNAPEVPKRNRKK